MMSIEFVICLLETGSWCLGVSLQGIGNICRQDIKSISLQYIETRLRETTNTLCVSASADFTGSLNSFDDKVRDL